MIFFGKSVPESSPMSAEGITDVGVVRTGNEDNFAVRLDDESPLGDALLAVADGMGGHAAGEIASQMSLDLLIDALSNSPSPTGRSLMGAVEQANDGVYKASFLGPNMQGMGTTLVAGLLVGSVMHICNVGDSRAYLLREGRLAQLTRDHSWVGDMVARGLLTPEQAAVHPRRSVLTRALGVSEDVQVDLTRVSLREGDRILLCSDGLYGLVDENTIATILNRRPLRSAARELVRLANAAGGTDNITVVVAQVNSIAGAVESESGDDVPEDTLAPGERRQSRTGVGLRLAGVDAGGAGDAGGGTGPPWRGRLPLAAAGGFGAIVVIAIIAFVVLQPGDGDEGDGVPDRLSFAVPSGNGTSTPTHTPGTDGEKASAADSVRAMAPTGIPDASATVSPTLTPSPTVTPTPSVTPIPTREPTATITPEPQGEQEESQPTSSPSPTLSAAPGQKAVNTQESESGSTTTPEGMVTPVSTTTPSKSPTATATPTPGTNDTPIPTLTPSPEATPTLEPTASPTFTPVPTNTPMPTPTLTSTVTPTPIPTPALAIESASVSNEDPAIWEEVIVSFTVRNQGKATADEFHVELVDNETSESLGKSDEVVGLEPGKDRDLNIVWRAEVTPRTLGLFVDSTHAEEGVHTLSSIEPFVPPYDFDRSISWRPQDPAINEEVTFWAYIKNTSSRDSEYDAKVAFYLDGEYHASTTLERSVRSGVTKQVKSLGWKAQRGSHEVLAVLYPSSYLDPNRSWDRSDERYAIATQTMAYDATRVPNLAVTKVEFLKRPVADADSIYLDLSFTVANEIGDGGTTPSLDDEFVVRVEFVEGPFCPLRDGEVPCTEDVLINGLKGGSEAIETVEGTVKIQLPPIGESYRFTAVVTVDPSNDVEELTRDDNVESKVYQVSR